MQKFGHNPRFRIDSDRAARESAQLLQDAGFQAETARMGTVYQ